MSKVKFDHYFTSSEEAQILHDWQKEYPELMKFHSICKTLGGRDIWAVEITNPKTGSMCSKPAYHVDGLTHAGELTGSMCAMYYIWYVLENYGKDEKVTRLVDDYALYVVPCMSPDGMDYVVAGNLEPRSADRPNKAQHLGPGLYGQDIDGDHHVRLMRRKNAYGAWKIDPEDPRMMILREPYDMGGEYYDVTIEGMYEGGEYDGGDFNVMNVQWGYDFNRNFPVAWVGEAIQKGAGEYPLCNTETKAMADYIIERKNISLVMTGHTMGGMLFYPPGPFAEEKAFPEDMRAYRILNGMGYDDMGYPPCCLNTDYKGHDISHGAFDDWMYIEQGIFATTIEFWNARVASGLPNNDFDPNGGGKITHGAKQSVKDYNHVVAWLTDTLGPEIFMQWTKFQHPQFGEVEIGGIDQCQCIRNPPPQMLENELNRCTKFYVKYGLAAPKLKITSISAKKEADGIYRVTALVANEGYLPTYGSKQALKMQKSDEVSVKINAPDGILEGGVSRKIGHLQGFASVQQVEGISYFFWSPKHEDRVKSVSWLVYGKSGDEITVTASTPKAGVASATVKL